MEAFYILILFLFAILNLILFFKIWGMTNNVKDLKASTNAIRDILLKKEGISLDEVKPNKTGDGWS